MIVRECLYCGPRVVISDLCREPNRVIDSIPCPTCHLDPAEIRMIEDVRTRGFEACYQEELQRDRARQQSRLRYMETPEQGKARAD